MNKSILITSMFFSLVITSCDNTVVDEVYNYLEYFPLDVSNKWTFQKTYVDSINNDSVITNTFLDTLYLETNIVDTLSDGNVVYSITRDGYYYNQVYLKNDTIFSVIYPPNDPNHKMYWKKDFSLDDEWVFYDISVGGPGFYYGVINSIINTDDVLETQKYSFEDCISLERSYTAISFYNEVCKYCKGVGLASIVGKRQSIDGTTDTFEYVLIDYEK